jgi:hypothetical protein
MRQNSVWANYLYLITTLLLISFSQLETEDVFIASPAPGQAVQGLIEIIGSANPENFEEYTLNFYLQDSNITTPFLIYKSGSPVESGKLGDWETSNLTDGTYILELQVNLSNGEELIHQIEGIRIRNYTAIETNTPEPTIQVTVQPMESTPAIEATPDTDKSVELGPNPAEINIKSIEQSIVRGVAISVIGILLLLSYILFKRRDN